MQIINQKKQLCTSVINVLPYYSYVICIVFHFIHSFLNSHHRYQYSVLLCVSQENELSPVWYKNVLKNGSFLFQNSFYFNAINHISFLVFSPFCVFEKKFDICVIEYDFFSSFNTFSSICKYKVQNMQNFIKEYFFLYLFVHVDAHQLHSSSSSSLPSSHKT